MYLEETNVKGEKLFCKEEQGMSKEEEETGGACSSHYKHGKLGQYANLHFLVSPYHCVISGMKTIPKRIHGIWMTFVMPE